MLPATYLAIHVARLRFWLLARYSYHLEPRGTWTNLEGFFLGATLRKFREIGRVCPLLHIHTLLLKFVLISKHEFLLSYRFKWQGPPSVSDLLTGNACSPLVYIFRSSFMPVYTVRTLVIPADVAADVFALAAGSLVVITYSIRILSYDFLGL